MVDYHKEEDVSPMVEYHKEEEGNPVVEYLKEEEGKPVVKYHKEEVGSANHHARLNLDLVAAVDNKVKSMVSADCFIICVFLT